MCSRSSKRHESSSKKHSSSSKSKTKPDDWTDVNEPEERRRIQNRIAQRKFREKAKEHKEKSERDSRNQEHAGRSYHVPESNEIVDPDDVSGLPWGGISMRHVVSRGHESESRRSGSGRDDYMRDDGQYYGHFGYYDYTQPGGYGSQDNGGSGSGSGSGDYYEDQTSSYSYPDFDTSGVGSSHT